MTGCIPRLLGVSAEARKTRCYTPSQAWPEADARKAAADLAEHLARHPGVANVWTSPTGEPFMLYVTVHSEDQWLRARENVEQIVLDAFSPARIAA